MKTKTLGLLILSFLTWSIGQTKTNEIKIEINDKEVKLYQVVDHNKIVQYYYTDIAQYPELKPSNCEEMHIRIYWDLLGNYLHFEKLKEEALTKVGGDEFEKNEYITLHGILNNKNSVMEICEYELLTPEETENDYHLDGITGATTTNLEYEIVEEAIKTAFTLWHISNGKITDKIAKISNTYFDEHSYEKKISLVNFKQASEQQKIAFLYKSYESEISLSKELSSYLIDELPKSNYSISNLILLTLYANDSSLQDYSNQLVSLYSELNELQKAMVYNILLDARKYKIVNSLELDFDKLNF